jgi:bifunctional non-homologous end joining protein LigD
MLEELHGKMMPPRVPSSSFKQRIKAKAETTWIKPKLVAEVRFTEWTCDGEMRHPAFLGLREDKKPTATVVLETEASPAAATS